MIEKVIGYVDGQPVFYEETEPTTYEAEANVESKPSHDLEISAYDEYNNVTTLRNVVYMSGWIEPIVDRNAQDLREQNERAYLNYFDLNRIEQDTEYLHDVLLAYGYSQQVVCKTDWVMADLPYIAEIERTRSNILNLLNGYYTQETELPTSLAGLTWRKLNAVEQNLKLMYEMIGRMEESFKRCGTFHAGQGVVF